MDLLTSCLYVCEWDGLTVAEFLGLIASERDAYFNTI